MIINFANLGGGGGGGYVLPVATSEVLGGVKIGDGVNIDSAGTISVQSSDPTILKSVSALPLTAASGDVCVYNDETYVYNTESSVNCSVANFSGYTTVNETFNVVQFYGELPSDEILFIMTYQRWGQVRYVSFDSSNEQFKVWEDDQMQTLSFTFPMNGVESSVWDNVNIRAYDGVITFVCRQINLLITLNGNWYEISGAHWEPIDWAYNIANPRKFIIDNISLPLASPSQKGAARVGQGLSMDNDGRLNVNFPTATTGQTGMVKIGSGISVSEDGTISASGGGIPTGTTGYVLIGQGDAAPTYTAPENITNGVKFWLGTQSEYNALSGTTGYDNSTLYVIK